MSNFKITGPGEYRTRSDEKAVVTNITAFGRTDSLGYNSWNEKGFRISEPVPDESDIIGPWVEPADEYLCCVCDSGHTDEQAARDCCKNQKQQPSAGEPVKTLRDEMAMAAMTGWLAASPEIAGEKIKNTREHADKLAYCAYLFADAMLAARQKTVDKQE